MLKFNMGCGQNRRPGYINVDAAAACGPDEVCDLEQTPWPWPDNCAEEVRFVHSLEHMGADTKSFLAIMTELYRICAPGAAVVIHAPDPRHRNFINDPTHVRAITPNVMELFDRERNEAWRQARAANTPLAFYTGVDFHTSACEALLSEPYRSRLREGSMTADAVREAADSLLNVIEEWRITLIARKPAVG